MAIGRVGSYGTDAPLQQNYVGDALTATENQGFRYRQERRNIADAKKVDEETKNKAIADEFDAFDKSLVPTITGYSSIDDPINMYAMDVKQKGVDWIRQKNQERDPYKKAEIQSKINKSTQSFKMLNQYPKLLNDKSAELEKGIMDGKYNERDLGAIQEISKSFGSGKYDMRVDENGVPRATIYKVDENGAPIGILEKNISLGDLINRITPFNKPTYDIKGGIAEQIKSQIELDESKVQNGFVTTTVEQRNKRVNDALKLKANEVASMPSEAYDLWQKMGNESKRTFNDADKKQISEYVFEDLKSRYGKKYEKDIDQSGALASRVQRKKEEETTPVIGTGSITTKTYALAEQEIPRGTKNFAISKAERKFGDGKIEKLKQVRVLPNGVLAFEVQETYEGSSTTTKVPNKSGKAKLNTINPATKKKFTEDDLLAENFESVTSTNKKPTTKVYKTDNNADDAENFSIMLINPETGKNFSGLKEATVYFQKKADGLQNLKNGSTPKAKTKQGTYDDL
jgi:hypothetical protein